MAQYRTVEVLIEVGALRQYLDTVKKHEIQETDNMFEEFETLPPAAGDHFEPESTGVFERADLDEELDAAEERISTIPIGRLMVEDLAQDASLSDIDRYATRRGSNHWTRRRSTQGPTRKLQDSDALAIRQGYARGHRVVDLAREFDVTTSTIYGVIRGKTHRREAAGWVETPAVAVP